MTRSRFQIHLSTTLLIMLLAGVVLSLHLSAEYEGAGDMRDIRNFGWPFPLITQTQYYSHGSIVFDDLRLFPTEYDTLPANYPGIATSFAIDFGGSLFILIFCAVLCECLLRRKHRVN